MVRLSLVWQVSIGGKTFLKCHAPMCPAMKQSSQHLANQHADWHVKQALEATRKKRARPAASQDITVLFNKIPRTPMSTRPRPRARPLLELRTSRVVQVPANFTKRHDGEPSCELAGPDCDHVGESASELQSLDHEDALLDHLINLEPDDHEVCSDHLLIYGIDHKRISNHINKIILFVTV